jgi:hypothetical protein
MKKFLSVFFGLIIVIPCSLFAESSSFLQLRGISQRISNTKVTILQLASNKTQVFFSIHNNSKYSDESQKFEFSGDDSRNTDLEIKKIGTDTHNTMFEILITNKNRSSSENRPLFLKISAN